MIQSALSPGSIFADRFEVRELVGAGGMGTIFRALDLQSQTMVALKLLATSGSFQEAERFLREGRLLSELKHTGIVGYVAHGQDRNGALYLAMEWLPGEDLSKRLSQGPLSVSDTLNLLIRVTEALVVPHRLSIVHRDLKPSNIFLRNGQVTDPVLLDFGIAKRQLGTHAVTATGALIGTPEYMSPEQARGSRELSPSTDIFSLGSVVYECLTGRPPFHGEHVASVLVKILFESPQAIAALRASVPDALSDVLLLMLEKDLQKRPADAMTLLPLLQSLHVATVDVAAPTLLFNPSTMGFGSDEQRLVSMVVAAVPADAAMDRRDTMAEQEEDQLVSLLAAIKQYGAVAEVLLNRSLVATLSNADDAADQAAKAARIALLIKEQWPDAMVVLTTGRAKTRGQTPVGEVADRAAKLLQRASAPMESTRPDSSARSGVWLDGISAGLLERRFIVTNKEGEHLLTGEEVSADHTRPLLGKPTQCVGREAELGILDTLLTTCIEENEVTSAIVIGAPGVGKSRLRHEFLRRLKSRGIEGMLLLGHATTIGAGQPYSLISDAIRRLCGLRGGEPLSFQRDQLRGRIAERLASEDVERVSTFLGEMCGIPFPAEERPQLRMARNDPRQMAKQIAQALGDFFKAECAEQPALLVIEDLQWSDPLTVRCLDEVLSELRDLPLMMIALARPEVYETFPKLWKGLGLREIRLPGLSRKAAERLVAQVLGRSVAPQIVAQIVERADGNALFLEELLRTTAELGSGMIPGTVLAMLQARLSRLEPGVRRVLKAASVIGNTFWDGTIAALVSPSGEYTAGQIDGWLHALQREELIEKGSATRFAKQTEYRLAHALMREAAYELLTEEDRRKGHDLVARFLVLTDPNCADLLTTESQRPVAFLLDSTPGRALLAEHGALFDIVYHQNRSVAADDDPTQIISCIELNLMAAKKAEAANATDTALQYVANGQKLLSAAIWSSHFDLSFEVCTRAAEYAYLSGDAQRSQREFLAVESQLRNFHQLTQYFTLRCSQAEMLGIPFDGKNEQLVEKLMASALEAE